jgi:flagellar basal body-associated protein FliL
MSFVDSGVSCQSTSDIHTDQDKQIQFGKKILIQIGISIMAIVLLIVVIAAFVYVFTSKQSSRTDIINYTTKTLGNISTTTVLHNLSATTTTG